jgi:hypothetical protein
VSEAAVGAVFNGRQLVSDLRAVRAEWNDKITARSDSAVWQIAGLLQRRPVINTALPTEELGIESKHARRYVEPLSKAWIILETSSGPRSRVWRYARGHRRTRRLCRTRAKGRAEIMTAIN